MQKVVDYKLVENGTRELVERDVRQSMSGGWVPSGPVVVLEGQLIQAMVKFEEA
jgi:hypothetical protein